jgi:nitrogen regulatory protein PII-like uncharacterized protein
MKVSKFLATFVVALGLFGCGGGGSSGGGPIPLTVKMSTTPAVVPSVPKGQKSVTISLAITVKSYGTTMNVVIQDYATGKVLSGIPGGSPTDFGTLGPMQQDIGMQVEVFANVAKTIDVFVDGVKEDAITLTASCASGTALDTNGVCN